MSAFPRTLLALALTVWVAPALAAPALAEREARTTRAVVACTSWAAWREFGQASLTARGARLSGRCPTRLAARTKVIVIDEDAGAGASEIRYRGQRLFVDALGLD
jgi:hypothetical protein